MPERFFDDDRHYIQRYDRARTNSASWLIPLLLLPIAFLGGWVANGYVNDGQLNRIVPGIETGVGGGPDDGTIISPLPTSGVERPSMTVTPTPTSETTSTTPTP